MIIVDQMGGFVKIRFLQITVNPSSVFGCAGEGYFFLIAVWMADGLIFNYILSQTNGVRPNKKVD